VITMIGLSTLIDSLLAGSAARADVGAIKREAEIGAAGAVPMVERAENEVRLPTRAAMERLVPSALADAPNPPPHADAPAPESSVQFEWSAAARIIRSVLSQAHGDAGPVRSPVVAWTPPASTTALAGSLAGIVEYSGLFYESHLGQLAVGARTLAQLQAEPQAAWGHARMAMAPDATAADGAQSDAAFGARNMEGKAGGTGGSDGLSPQAVTLVHQQLDLLATSALRVNAEAWPGVPMQWSIQPPPQPVLQEQEQAPSDESAEPAPPAERTWFTTLALQLPRLGPIDVRLGIAGDGVQAHLAARHEASVELLAGDGAAFAGRLQAAGLHLREFQVRTPVDAPVDEVRS
jgi:hypothetical protein